MRFSKLSVSKLSLALLSTLAVSCGDTSITPSASSSVSTTPTPSVSISEHRLRDKGSSSTRTIPVVNKDSDGLYDSNIESVDHAALNACGTTHATIAERIADCASVNGDVATWTGSERSNSAHGTWKLVSKTSNGATGKEVWRDEITGLLWSDYVGKIDGSGDPEFTVNGAQDPDTRFSQSTFSWCLASGNTENAGEVDCRSASAGSYNQAGVSLCAEGTGLTTPNGGHSSDTAANLISTWTSTGTSIIDAKGGMLKTASATSPSVEWWLPSRENFFQAYAHGMLYVLPRFKSCGLGSGVSAYECKYWTSSICSYPYTGPAKRTAHLFQVNRDGYVQVPDKDRNSNYLVRCVGR